MEFGPKNDGEKWCRKNIFEIAIYMREPIFGPIHLLQKSDDLGLKIQIQ